MATYRGDGTDWVTLARTVSLGRWRGLGCKDGRSNAVSAAAAAGGPVITAPQLQPREGTSSSHWIIAPLISCLSWPLPLKCESPIWSFIKNFFSRIVEKDFVFTKKKKKEFYKSLPCIPVEKIEKK